MKPHYLYKITNLVNGKMYIGITQNPRLRKWQHLNHRHPDTMSAVKYAIDKHGKENFIFEVICIGTKEYIIELEPKTINLYSTLAPNGYNISIGGECGAASSINKRTDDKPIFVTGFWFPNRRLALAMTNIGRGTFYNRLKNGTLGDVQLNLKKMNQPIYVGGFWFPTSKMAGNILGITAKAITKRIRDGFIEQKGSTNYASGGSHPHTGKIGKECANSKPVIIDEIEYASITEAIKFSRHSESKIYRRLKSNHPDFKYKEEK